jgi:hypothetical protein
MAPGPPNQRGILIAVLGVHHIAAAILPAVMIL